jgi:Tfp pilus assembly protein PilO
MNALRSLYDNLGWPGVAGILLILLAGAMTLSLVQPQTAQLAELKQANQSLKTRIARAAREGIPASGSQDDLTRFYGFFNGSAPTQWLDKLYTAAAAQDLVLTQGEYRMMADRTGKLARYQISLPVKGSYVQIRRFVAQVLNDVPVAALEEISFKRENIGAAQLEAHIKLTLFLSADRAGLP